MNELSTVHTTMILCGWNESFLIFIVKLKFSWWKTINSVRIKSITVLVTQQCTKHYAPRTILPWQTISMKWNHCSFSADFLFLWQSEFFHIACFHVFSVCTVHMYKHYDFQLSNSRNRYIGNNVLFKIDIAVMVHYFDSIISKKK